MMCPLMVMSHYQWRTIREGLESESQMPQKDEQKDQPQDKTDDLLDGLRNRQHSKNQEDDVNHNRQNQEPNQ